MVSLLWLSLHDNTGITVVLNAKRQQSPATLPGKSTSLYQALENFIKSYCQQLVILPFH